MTDPCVTEAMIDAGVKAFRSEGIALWLERCPGEPLPDEPDEDELAALRRFVASIYTAMHSSRPVEDGPTYEMNADERAAMYSALRASTKTVGVMVRPKEDGLSCEMCDDPATCPAEQCAFRTTQASELVALKGEVERIDAMPTNFELSYGEVNSDMSECAWHVHRVNGGYNDREWTLVATADTPTEAIRQALTVSPEKPARRMPL